MNLKNRSFSNTKKRMFFELDMKINQSMGNDALADIFLGKHQFGASPMPYLCLVKWELIGVIDLGPGFQALLQVDVKWTFHFSSHLKL